MQVLFKKTQIVRYILCRTHLSSLSGQANLVWACDDVVAYFSSSGRFQRTAWQRNENIKLWTHFFHLGSKGHDPQVGEQINI